MKVAPVVVKKQAMVMGVKVMVLCHLMVVILHQKEFHLIGVGEQAINTSHNGVGSWDSDDCALSVQASNVFLLLMMANTLPKQLNSKDQDDQYQSRSSWSARNNHFVLRTINYKSPSLKITRKLIPAKHIFLHLWKRCFKII